MQIRKTFKAETAHRVADAYSTRCRGLHGHSYLFEVILEGNELDECGMVIDFKRLKDGVNKFMDSFDHSLLIWDKDSFLVKNAEQLNKRNIIVPYNPTAELMAVHIYKYIEQFYNIVEVKVHETATGYASYKGEPLNYDIDLSEVVMSKGILNEL